MNTPGNYNSRILATLILLTLVFITPARLWSYELEKQVKKYTLDNGLIVLMLARHTSPTVSLYIRHRVGAVDEPTGRPALLIYWST